MGSFPKTAHLKDGTEVVLRPLHKDDLDRSHQFFLALPEEDRLYLRMDVTDRQNVGIRMEHSDAVERWSLVALLGEKIIGDAFLLQPRHGWKQHTAEIRCVVAHSYQGRGLGTIMLKELFQEATRRRVEKVIGAVTAEETSGKRIVEALGFRQEMIRHNHMRSLHGELHDVIIMTADINEAWARMEDLMHGMDGRGRERHPRRRAKP
ncbi:MAG: GNAT family N-acetyltransferase [Candidatus Eisenbacteria sp.]|nr:GNAT family N-acetyltransferase [Candidatus Eisenbacteria bacterium]